MRPTPGLGGRWRRRPRRVRAGRAGRRAALARAGAAHDPRPGRAVRDVNRARFGTLFSVPWTAPGALPAPPAHRARAAARTAATYFGFQFAPTTLFQYFRPDALGRGSVFPWVTFPRFRPTVVGDAVIDMLDHVDQRAVVDAGAPDPHRARLRRRVAHPIRRHRSRGGAAGTARSVRSARSHS